MTRIEHLNITVPDIDAALAFLRIVAPDFRVRKDETPEGSYRWAHVGNEHHYLALQEPHLDSNPSNPHQTYKNYGVNHIGLVVENLEQIEHRLDRAGYRRSIAAPEESYRKRAYFYDSAGFEWELVQYFTELPAEKYLYE